MTDAETSPRRDVPNTRERQREETRRRVYLAALEVFRRDGVQACRIEDIAALAGVSRGAFYFHFPSKDDVLVEVLRESSDRVAARVAALPEALPAMAVLAGVGEAIAAEWEDDFRLFPDVATVALRFSGGAPPGAVDPVRELVRARFVAAGERGELHPLVPPETLADLFLIQQFAVALAWCGNPVVPLRQALEGAAQLFLVGAAHPGGARDAAG